MGRVSVGGALATAAPIHVAVAITPGPGRAVEVEVEVAQGSSALDAIRASGVLERCAEVDISSQWVGVWGRRCALETILKEGDRVEIYRPLAVDPKEARRQRARRP
jgi:putative ubiquitin-RnfH superfamily antitoxin RatB of RatAB toxin-antitoxin module